MYGALLGYFRQFINPVQNVSPGSGMSGHLSQICVLFAQSDYMYVQTREIDMWEKSNRILKSATMSKIWIKSIIDKELDVRYINMQMVCLLTISFFSKCQKWWDDEVSYFSHTHAQQPFIQAFYEPTFPNHWILRLGTLVAACSYKINQHTSGYIWYMTCVHSDTWSAFRC